MLCNMHRPQALSTAGVIWVIKFDTMLQCCCQARCTLCRLREGELDPGEIRDGGAGGVCPV